MAKYWKAIVALIGAIMVTLAQQFPNDKWVTIAFSVYTALMVYIVPNESVTTVKETAKSGD